MGTNNPSPKPDAAQITRAAMEWLGSRRDGDPDAANKIGKRAIAACFVVRASIADDLPMIKVASRFRIKRVDFEAMVLDFQKCTGIKRSFIEADEGPPDNKKPADVAEGGLRSEPNVFAERLNASHESADTYPDAESQTGKAAHV